MASEKVLKFVEDIKELSVLELAELVDAIQNRLRRTIVGYLVVEGCRLSS